MGTYSTGVAFSFKSVNYTVTSLTYSLGSTGGADQIDASHLGLTTGASVISLPRPLKGTPGGDTGKTVSIEFIGTAPIAQNESGALTITGPVSVSSTAASCVSSSVTLTLNDIVRGSAEFQLP
jgi:hypothetical protein